MLYDRFYFRLNAFIMIENISNHMVLIQAKIQRQHVV